MKNLTEKEYQQELEKIQKQNKQIKYNLLLKKERNKFKKKFKFETSKLVAIYLANCIYHTISDGLLWRYGSKRLIPLYYIVFQEEILNGYIS